MSAVSSKNRDIIKKITGNEELSSRLQNIRIGIWSEEKSNKNSGILLAEALGEFLGRFWKNIDVIGPLSNIFRNSSISAASSGNLNHNFQESWNPPYDYVISIGAGIPNNCPNGISIGAKNWNVTTGANSEVDENKNPVGPLAAASIASSEAFKFAFKDALTTRISEMPSNYFWSAWYGGTSKNPDIGKMIFKDIHVFGVGAVSHGLLWILERWPMEITGSIHLVDHDNYDESNAQRYIGMRQDDLGKPKVLQVAFRLKQKQPTLEVVVHHMDMNTYFRDLKPDCRINLAVAGLDSIEHRKHLALKLPKKIVNMWTEEDNLGASRFGFEQNWPCVFCIHPENNAPEPDETSRIYKQFGIHPARVRELLYSSAFINQEDASLLAQKLQVDANSIVGKSLRSILGQACMQGKITIPTATSDANVTFGFASGLAGVGGFVELFRELNDIESEPGFWQTSVLRYPTEYSWKSRTKVDHCYLCSDEDIPKILAMKYDSS